MPIIHSNSWQNDDDDSPILQQVWQQHLVHHAATVNTCWLGAGS